MQRSTPRAKYPLVFPIVLLLATALACGNEASVERNTSTVDAAPAGKVSSAEALSQSRATPGS